MKFVNGQKGLNHLHPSIKITSSNPFNFMIKSVIDFRLSVYLCLKNFREVIQVNKTIHIHICPIKMFYLRVAEMADPSGVAAVLCTTGSINESKLAGISYLHVPFADITDASKSDAFQLEQARQIRGFLDRQTQATEFYFCCDSGESRSTALAAAWMHYSEQDEMKIWKNVRYHPNELVYYLQSIACDLPITRTDAQELAEYNRMLFQRAITNQ